MSRFKFSVIGLVAAVVILAGYVILFSGPQPAGVVEDETPVANEVLNSEPAAGEEIADAPAEERAAPDATGVMSPAVDVDAAMQNRSLGAEDAPVVIQEYASLTCSHCAHFHEQTFGQLKEAYVDTGKVRFVFNDFPLNTPARDAAVVARCMPENQYFRYIGFLFETQEDWAYDSGYRQYLIQNAKLLGGNEAAIEACLESDELKLALAEKMQNAAETFQIRSTPSFVVNGDQVVKGMQPFSSMKRIIDAKLEESSTTE